MNKRFFSLALAAGLIVTNVSVSSANEVEKNVELSTLELSATNQSTDASLVSNVSSINYSEFLKNGGTAQRVKLDLKGAKITAKSVYELNAAISQNYDVMTSLTSDYTSDSLEIGVFSPNPGVKYLDNWEITIDSSVLDIDQDLTIKIPVVDDSKVVETPNIIASRTSVTKDELINGFDLVLEPANGSKFNIACTAYEPRVSIIKTANIDLQVLPYCNEIAPNRIKFHIKAMNGVPYYRETLEFSIEGNATNSKEPLKVKIDIESDVNQSDLDKLKNMIKNAPNVTTQEYTQESYVKFQRTIRAAANLAYSNNPGQTEVKDMIDKLADAIDSLEKIEKLDEVVKIEDASLKNAIKKSLGIKSNDITVGDMKKVKALNFEDDMYLQNLNGLEYATNLESLNINYNEVMDLSPLKNLVNLKDVTGLENYVMSPGTVKPNDKNLFVLENNAIDVDGKPMKPSKVVISPNKNPQELKVEDVFIDGKIKIDASLVEGTSSVEVLYESEYNNFQVYSFNFIENK